jgi:membrane protein YqaA with SNARE-associated domain
MPFPAAALWCFALTLISAVVPWVNAEIIVLSLPATAQSRLALAALVGIATVGQMAGKCVVYRAARRGSQAPSPRVRAQLAKWQARFEAHRWAPVVLVLWSSTSGLPPFYVTTMLAGALKMNLPLFLAVGTAGRLVRFGGLIAGATWLTGGVP